MDGARNRNRRAEGDAGKVALFVQYQRDGLSPARQPDGQVIAEPEGRVVPAIRNAHKRKIRKVGALVPEEALDDGVIHFHLGW